VPRNQGPACRRERGLGAESFGRKAKDRRKKAHRVDLYPKVLIRPVCGCCSNPMILGRSVGKYQSFFCFNANNGIYGCTNRGYKSARIIDEAVLGTVMATLFTDRFLADLTADVNKRLAWIARQQLQGDVGVAAQVLKALVGDVILETRQVEGQAKPQMVAGFTINTVPALAALERERPTDRDVAPAPVLDSIHSRPPAEPAPTGGPADVIVPLIYDRRAAARKP